MTHSSNFLSIKANESSTKRFTRTFESKLFPHFSIFTSESIVSAQPCSFLVEYTQQISRIKNLLTLDALKEDSIKDFNGNIHKVRTIDYKNPPDSLIAAICSYGIEWSLAYQMYKMVYSYRIEAISLKSEEIELNGVETYNVTHKLFNIDNFKAENLNPLAKLHYKYSVFLEKEVVKTAFFAKAKEIKPKYNVKISAPSPHIVSEIYITDIPDQNVVIFNIPNLFSDEETHLYLPIKIESKEQFDLIIEHFKVNQNVFLSILRLNADGTLTLKFEGLSIINEFFLNRRAAITENEGGSSSNFYKFKLQEIAISTETREDYCVIKSMSLTRKRLKLEEDMQNKIDDEDFILRISRSKQVMHNIKNVRSNC